MGIIDKNHKAGLNFWRFWSIVMVRIGADGFLHRFRGSIIPEHLQNCQMDEHLEDDSWITE